MFYIMDSLIQFSSSHLSHLEPEPRWAEAATWTTWTWTQLITGRCQAYRARPEARAPVLQGLAIHGDPGLTIKVSARGREINKINNKKNKNKINNKIKNGSN